MKVNKKNNIMMKTNSEIRKTARMALDGKWGTFVMLTLVFYVVSLFTALPGQLGDALIKADVMTDLGAVLSSFGFVLTLLMLPLSWGYVVSLLRNHRGGDVEVSNIFDGFRQYGRVWFTVFLTGLYTFLWTLVLIVPGIVKSCSYGVTNYVLYDNPDLSGNAAIERSMAMMEGHKMQLFLLALSFIGWGILCLFTLCVGFLWLVPYVQASMAAFYEEVKADYEARTGVVS